MVKLIMTWNIREGKENECVEFLTHDFVKDTLDMGIQPTDAWYAVWGRGPQVLVGGVAQDMDAMDKALASNLWKAFQEKLARIAVNFEHKVVDTSGGFQL